MHNKQLLILLLTLSLGGCASLTNTQPVEVVDKSLNQTTLPTQHTESAAPTESTIFRTSYNTPTDTTPEVVKPKVDTADKPGKTWVRPVMANIGKTFSKTHPGLSFNTQPGMPVGAIRDGKVIYHNDSMVMLRHSLGFYSIYHHIKPQVSDNQTITQSQVLGTTTDKVLYLEMKKFKDLINPMPYLK